MADNIQLPEAPVSNTFKVKSSNGFEHLFTMRDSSVKELISKIETVEKVLLDKGWTPLAQQSGFGRKEAKPIEYVDGLKCPTDGGRLIRTTTKAGKKLIKCENNKWNFQLQRAEGCPYTKWESEAPVRDIREDY